MLPFKTAQVTASSWVHAVGQPDQPWVNHQLPPLLAQTGFPGNLHLLRLFPANPTARTGLWWWAVEKVHSNKRLGKERLYILQPIFCFQPGNGYSKQIELTKVENAETYYFDLFWGPMLTSRPNKRCEVGQFLWVASARGLYTLTSHLLNGRILQPSSASSRLCKSVVTIVKAGFPNVAQS